MRAIRSDVCSPATCVYTYRMIREIVIGVASAATWELIRSRSGDIRVVAAYGLLLFGSACFFAAAWIDQKEGLLFVS